MNTFYNYTNGDEDSGERTPAYTPPHADGRASGEAVGKDAQEPMRSKAGEVKEYLPASILTAFFVFLLPLVFSFSLSLSSEALKGSLIALFVVLSILSASLYSLKTGYIKISWGFGSLLAFLLALIYLAAAFFSPSFRASFLGATGGAMVGIQVGFLALMGILLAHQAISRTKIVLSIIALWSSFLIIFLYHFARFILGADFLSFGQFLTQTATPLGKWHELALFAALSGITALALSESKVFARWGKAMSRVVVVLSFLILFVVDFDLAWILFGVFALIFFVRGFISQGYQASKESDGGGVNVAIPTIPLVVFLIALAGLFVGNFLSLSVAERVGIGYVEVRPSWNATWDINSDVLRSSPLLGLGPDRFKDAWRLHKPEAINETIFWNVDYRTGFGVIPSSPTTIGILGFIAWSLFGLWILYGLWKELVSRDDGVVSRLSLALASGTLFLWLTSFFYAPSITLLALLFVFAGLFQSTLIIRGRGKVHHIQFLTTSGKALVGVTVLLILILLSLGLGYLESQRLAAKKSFGDALVALNQDDIEGSFASLSKALSYGESDIYYRLMTGLVIRDLERTIAEEGQDLSPEAFQASVSNALGLAGRALDFDRSNYDNWVLVGGLYEYLANFGIDGAVEASASSYEEARSLNPATPAIDLSLARLSIIEENRARAEELILKSLEKKSNYTQALVLLSEIELATGDRDAAVRTMTRAALSSPDDPNVFFGLGALLFELERYPESIQALERAVIANPVFSNAKYLLGLAYYEVGRLNDAVDQFRDLETLNPENELVEQILSNLISGRAPFSE